MAPKTPFPVLPKHLQPGRKISSLYSAEPKFPSTIFGLYSDARKTMNVMLGFVWIQASYALYEPLH